MFLFRNKLYLFLLISFKFPKTPSQPAPYLNNPEEAITITTKTTQPPQQTFFKLVYNSCPASSMAYRPSGYILYFSHFSKIIKTFLKAIGSHQCA
jgi:hypothetical protein